MQNNYDTIIVGAGPAGLIAAYSAADNGQKVLLLEKNDSPGKKLLITGKGRCNITHAEDDNRLFMEPFGKKGKFLYSPLSSFGVNDILKLLQSHGLETMQERGKRIFPVSEKATDVLKVLEDLLLEKDVELLKNCTANRLIADGQHISAVSTNHGEFRAKRFILATGGLSYPSTGCSGDGYRFAEDMGHTIIKPRPALIGLKLGVNWLSAIPGVELKNVKVTVFQNNKKQDERFGEALFTHVGISGPIILDMSGHIGELLLKGSVELKIDFKPAVDYQQLDKRLQRLLQEVNNKAARHIFDKLLPKRLRPLFLKLSGIDAEKKANEITKVERRKIIALLKEFAIPITNLEGIEKAIITAGGIALKEIDSKTMRSRIVDNLYFAGEIIDLDGPTGGFNLQICWSTGFVAGSKR